MAGLSDDFFSVFDEAEETSGEPDIPIPIKVEEDDEPLQSEPSGSKEEVPEARSKRPNEADEKNEAKKTKLDDDLLDINLEALDTRIMVHTVETLEACTHEVAVPPNTEYIPLKQRIGKPAKEYPFLLDPFQKEAILCIDNNQSVLVSAHTSAGKTVTAEYAIALSLQSKQRVIYTTPIKALSNQKYREFYEEFKDVGLVTGDVTINPTASCLIMTTEILRNMLYRGSEVMREVGWVIFDEIHYMRDKERGVVWEETLILLPDTVHFVFLSATIPNARQFAEWVAHLHHQPCHVVYTDYRPVPLQHYLFPAGGDGIHLVVDENGQFKEDNFNAAMTVLAMAGEDAKPQEPGRRGGPRNGAETNCFKIIKMVMERNFAPVIIFSFSKKECESYALQMSRLDFNNQEEKKLVDEVFTNAMDVLSEEDKHLPQVENVLPLLKRGIGIHHGGLLPILKETIEILFAEGLIKALFATETFAMGLNMPARTVLFTNTSKYDGKDFRYVTPGEYIQMSGRAGRRGLDEKGIVILMVDSKVSPQVGRELVMGQPDPINSAFHLSYNMVLNLLRVEGINPEYMLERSFFQFQNNSRIPELVQKVIDLQAEYDKMVVPKESQVAKYYHVRQQLDELGRQFQTHLTLPENITPFLQPGRMVKVKSGDNEFDWGVIINYKQENPKERRWNKLRSPVIVEVLLHVAESDSQFPRPCPPGQTGDMEVVPVLGSLISKISSLRVHYPKDLRPPDNRKSVLKTVQEVKKRFPDGPPLLNPIKDMQIKDENFIGVIKQIESLEKRMYDHPLHSHPDLAEMYAQYSKKVDIENQVKMVKGELKKAKSLLHMDELKCRKRILRRLGYATATDIIELKGRVACELSGCDELLMTEMIFNGLFNDLTVAQCVSLISCFVCDEKTAETPKMSDELSGLLRQMQDFARRIAKVSNDSKLEIDEHDYVTQFKPFLMDVVYAWCNGATFLRVCKMTDIFEGSIIRCMRRLEEVLRQLVQAAKNIGNSDLENKFDEGIKLIKRDIVFAASLYL